ncbi:MAG: hypothetical protein ACR2LR_00460 [Hassallia sp.]
MVSPSPYGVHTSPVCPQAKAWGYTNKAHEDGLNTEKTNSSLRSSGFVREPATLV